MYLFSIPRFVASVLCFVLMTQIRDSIGISKLTLLQLILPNKISCNVASLKIPLQFLMTQMTMIWILAQGR